MNEIDIKSRMKNLIGIDKIENPSRIERVLKAELVNVIKNYFEINSDDLKVDIIVNSDYKYDIQINVISRGMKFANTF